jgi:hypothetical protein
MQHLLIAKVTLVSEIPNGDLSIFDTIVTKALKHNKVHVQKVQGRHFSEKQKPVGRSTSLQRACKIECQSL